MNCSEYQRMISKFVDFEIKATQNVNMFEHLAKCAQCREFFDVLMNLNVELDKVQNPVALDQMDSSVSVKDRTVSRSLPVRYVLAFVHHGFWIRAPVATLVAVAVLVFVLMMTQMPQEKKHVASVRQDIPISRTILPVVKIP